MEFDLFELDKSLIDLFSEQSSLNEQQTSITTTKNCDRHYCLIIFNNPSWSQRLRKQRSKQTTLQQTQHISNHSGSIMIKNEKQDASIDNEFIAQLRQLLDNYMKHTTRPFPMKYFLDFTDH